MKFLITYFFNSIFLKSKWHWLNNDLVNQFATVSIKAINFPSIFEIQSWNQLIQAFDDTSLLTLVIVYHRKLGAFPFRLLTQGTPTQKLLAMQIKDQLKWLYYYFPALRKALEGTFQECLFYNIDHDAQNFYCLWFAMHQEYYII